MLHTHVSPMRYPALAVLLVAALAALAARSSADQGANPPAPRVSYTPLSAEARRTGQLRRYDRVPVRQGKVRLGPYELSYAVPRAARAYDVVPVRYSLAQPAGARVAAVEAVAFEDPRKAGERPLYDLAIPGRMGVRIDYLGSVCADFRPDRYVPLTPDPKTPVSPFPPYDCDPQVRSSVIRPAQAVWFRFRVTNTGDTIMDPEGFGATFAEPLLQKLGPDGKPEWQATTINSFERHTRYVYPGESWDLWVNFFCARYGDFCRGLREGDYRIDFRMVYRYHRSYVWGINIWTGAEFARLEVPIRVREHPATEPVTPAFRMVDTGDKMPGYWDAFEEFMTAFRIHQPVERPTTTKGVLYLQVAPWTRKVVVKLVLAGPSQIAAAKAPIAVSDETLRITRNPRNRMVVRRGGREKPAFVAMFLPAMRSGFQLGPHPEAGLDEAAAEMRALGVDVIANSAGNWWIPEVAGRKGVELHSACYKYFYDVLARKHGLKLLGWSLYPPSHRVWYDCAEPLLGRKLSPSMAAAGYQPVTESVDMGDPVVPEVIAAWAIYNYRRWGDQWFRTRDGVIPIDVEDTWGWLRDDINVRYPVGPLGVARFRQWLCARYGTIEKVNAAWGSHLAGFDAVDPQAGQGIEGDGMSHGPVYNVPGSVFRDWSPAVEDWDVFRTELRMEILRKANAILRRVIPRGELYNTTEGANLLIHGDGLSDETHWRHVYYAQRRNALVFDVLKRENVLHYYNDYTTLPYTMAQWRQAMREMVRAGITPMFLPQFLDMRDILLNPHYGREYKVHYNLPAPSKGMMVHCLMAAYPWWKATYEEGGMPGIVWDDYCCDAFATETQKRELRLLTAQFGRMAPAPRARPRG